MAKSEGTAKQRTENNLQKLEAVTNQQLVRPWGPWFCTYKELISENNLRDLESVFFLSQALGEDTVSPYFPSAL